MLVLTEHRHRGGTVTLDQLGRVDVGTPLGVVSGVGHVVEHRGGVGWYDGTNGHGAYGVAHDREGMSQSEVELRGFEPLTPWLQTRCSAN